VPYYRSSGLYNNHTFVFPSLNMVVVRVGTDGWSQHGGSTSTFLRPIMEAAGQSSRGLLEPDIREVY
jgi:hypothetical protein